MLTCYIVAGALWISPGESDVMFQATWLNKIVGSEFIQYREPDGDVHNAFVYPHQYGQHTAEWMNDCLTNAEYFGYGYPTEGYGIAGDNDY